MLVESRGYIGVLYFQRTTGDQGRKPCKTIWEVQGPFKPCRKEVNDMDQSLEEQNSSLLAAALDSHLITDSEGQIAEDTASGESAPQETNTEEQTAPSEKTAEEESTPTQEVDESDETNLAVDDSGKRYIPEKRFKKTYAEKKQLERENEALKALVTSTVPVGTNVQPTPTQTSSNPDLDRLELKMVYKEYPQFNPNSEEYSPEIDKLAGNLRRANNLSVTDAAEEAMKMVKKFTSDQVQVAREARTVKALQSDQGITSRVVSREPQQPDFDAMTLEQKEQYLRDKGMW